MIDLKVNGVLRHLSSAPDTPLLYVLREELQLNGAKFGCGLGQCGACTVLVDGHATFSCVVPILVLDGRDILTIEGLGTQESPGPMQQAFIEEQAAQCGYCIPGMMMRAQALLQKNPRASDADIRAALQPQLCRCGTHMRILRAVRRAAALMQSGVTVAARNALPPDNPSGNPSQKTSEKPSDKPSESGRNELENLRQSESKELRQRPER